MSRSLSTQEKLLNAARELFWTRGYSHVSVRDIAKIAGVDVALISRYFGSKQGLFEATLAIIPVWEALESAPEDLLSKAVASFSCPFDRVTDQANPFTMLLVNGVDPVMGDKMKDLVQTGLVKPLAAKLGGKKADQRAAMLLAALFGFALMRKNFQIAALTDKSVEEIEELVFRLARTAISDCVVEQNRPRSAV